MQQPICTSAITSSGVSTRSMTPHYVGPKSDRRFTDMATKIAGTSSGFGSHVWGISIILRT